MAYKDSETLQAGTPYALGEYSFNCVFDDSPTLGQFARASMTKDGQTVYKTVSIPNASQISGWTVEANDDTADVYAVIEIPKGEGKASDLGLTIDYASGSSASVMSESLGYGELYRATSGEGPFYYFGSSLTNTYSTYIGVWVVSPKSFSGEVTNYYGSEHPIKSVIGASSYSYNGKTAYYIGRHAYQSSFDPHTDAPMNILPDEDYVEGKAAWVVCYGTQVPSEYEEKEMLIGRFAIDLEDAGGVGPGGGIGGGWTDPGDCDPDWEEGDPTHTLYVTVTGALSGRHNDPIVDPSYSYIPADKDTVKDYGCGGDGGHGGGGGAGASTVVIHKFATNQANSKEVTAIARRHGYGSGGGKGGKGGDGCILVYY